MRVAFIEVTGIFARRGDEPVTEAQMRGRSDLREKITAAMRVVHDDALMMRLAGEAIAAVSTATTIDAVVMATAAWKGALVYTSDVGDLERLQRVFPSVRV